MRTIALAIIALAALLARAAADPASWRTITTRDGVNYLLDVGSIERRLDAAGLPTQAYLVVYRDDGGPPDARGFHVIWFDCRGSYRLLDDVETTRRITYGSVISRVEDVACWGPTSPAR